MLMVFFQPSLLLRHPSVVCNLKECSLKYTLTRFFPGVRKTKATHPEYLRRCARCFLHGLCEQCPAKSWMEHGTLDTPVEYFFQAAFNSQARFLGLIKENEHAWEVKRCQDRLKEFCGLDPSSRAIHPRRM